MDDILTLTRAKSALASLEVRAAGAKGRGVFATAPIAKGTLITEMSGYTLKSSELNDEVMALQVDDELWLCTMGEYLDDYVNHSCEANAGFLQGTTTLYALKDIRPGEEISFDYSTSLSEEGWSMDCACGTPACRKTVVSWGALPEETRRRLLPAALSYLRGKKGGLAA